MMNTSLGNRDIIYPDYDCLYVAHPGELSFFQRVWFCIFNRYDDRVC
jgi:hypothetical protein